MGSTHSGSPSPLLAMIEDSTVEFPMVSKVEESSSPPLPEDIACGLHLLSSQPHHRWRAHRPLRQRRWFHCGRQRHGRTPTSPLSDNTLFRRSNEHEPTPSNSTLSTRQHNDETDSPSNMPPLRCGPTHKAKRILMVDLAVTQLQAKGAAPPPWHGSTKNRLGHPPPQCSETKKYT
jgi:hypothetical protein